MLYHIQTIENKAEGWKIADLKALDGTEIENVSINKIDKKTGETAFQDFDSLVEGGSIQGELWTNPAGKHYLFAPKKAAPRAGNTAPGIKAAQERKETGIAKAQDRKETGMKIAASFRDATLLLTNMAGYKDMTPDEIQGQHKFLRRWLMAEWDSEEKRLDVPFN